MTTLRELGELGLLARLVPHLSRAGGDLLIGAGEDDNAAWRERDGTVTVAKVDTFVEGVHFDLSWMPPETAGWRACALTLSDLAAKAATPTYGLVSLSAPPATDAKLVEDLYEGMAACAREFGLRLVGGDTTSTPGPLTLSVVALGRCEHLPLSRSAARAGWSIAITGPLGGEAVALAERRPTRPRPRFGIAPRDGACGDISDGLIRELVKFRAAANLGARIDSAAVPVAEGATLEQALTSGEEVELIVASPGRPVAPVIGTFTGDGRILVDDVEREAGGYDHYA